MSILTFRDLLNNIIKGATTSLAQFLKNEACIGTRIRPQFLFLMEKYILYAKITVSKKNCFKTEF